MSEEKPDDSPETTVANLINDVMIGLLLVLAVVSMGFIAARRGHELARDWPHHAIEHLWAMCNLLISGGLAVAFAIALWRKRLRRRAKSPSNPSAAR